MGGGETIRHAVITGITSFIGISLSRLLSERGTEVTGIIRPGSSRKEAVASIPGVRVIERELSDIDTTLKKEIPRADCFFHMGWDSSFPNSRYNPMQTVNIGSTMKAVELAKEIGCGTFIGVGSQAECGRVNSKIKENTPNSPENEYGSAKVRAAEESTALCERYGIRCVWPRLLSAYGPFDRPHTMVMSCIRACLNDLKMEMTPCGQIWDYIYIDDAADALLSIAKKGKHGVRYPIGSGDERPLREYVEKIAEKTGKDVGMLGIGLKQYTEGQPMYLSADISTLTKDTGFRPEYSFDAGIERTIEWVRSEQQTGGRPRQ